MKQTREQDRLGWWSAGMLTLFVALFLSAAPARALDLDQQIHKSETESVQILKTLGRGKPAGMSDANSSVHLRLIKVRKAHSKAPKKARHARKGHKAPKARKA